MLRTYRRIAGEKRKAKVNDTAFIKALCHKMRGVAKSMSKEDPKAHQNPVQDVPKPFKIEAWDAPGSQNVALKLPSTAKRQPRAPQKCPRDAQ